MGYAFGDSERAARRLALVAEAFAEPTRAFLREAGAAGCALAVDLGCGPGHTTRLLAEMLGGARVVGMDASQAYIAQARSAVPGCEFLCHDALDLPWPTDPPDLVYARFLLSHVSEPEAAVSRFASQLRPGGRLLLDEVEAIHTTDPVFRRYLGYVERVLAARGHCLFVGPRLASLAGVGVLTSEVRRHEVAPPRAAALFALNWATLRERSEDLSRAGSDASECDTLARQLASLRRGAARAGRITWELRQVTIEG